MKRHYKLLQILLTYAPDEAAKEQILHIYGAMISNGEADKYIEGNLVKMMYDGLWIDTWPWIDMEKDVKVISTGIEV